MGKLAQLYSLADLVIIGGSFSGDGGHNFMEAAAHARPIMVGPDTRNFKGIANYFLENGGLIQVASMPELENSMQELLDDEKARDRLGLKAYELLHKNLGAAKKYADMILDLAQSHQLAPRPLRSLR
jgi:3-deoxy-D-manno-octulosonic-acid transferase